jgi:hypothetical protein
MGKVYGAPYVKEDCCRPASPSRCGAHTMTQIGPSYIRSSWFQPPIMPVIQPTACAMETCAWISIAILVASFAIAAISAASKCTYLGEECATQTVCDRYEICNWPHLFGLQVCRLVEECHPERICTPIWNCTD